METITKLYPSTKQCRGCDEVKSRDQFYSEPRCRDGLRGKCKTCMNTYNRNHPPNPSRRQNYQPGHSMKCGDYNKVIAPPDYPGPVQQGVYCYEHHLVWWQTHHEILATGEQIHHKDLDGHNNDPLNLEKKTDKAHGKWHHPGNKRPYTCEACGEIFYHNNPTRRHRFCSRKCVGSALGKGTL
jgi:hypothetical protein